MQHKQELQKLQKRKEKVKEAQKKLDAAIVKLQVVEQKRAKAQEVLQ